MLRTWQCTWLLPHCSVTTVDLSWSCRVCVEAWVGEGRAIGSVSAVIPPTFTGIYPWQHSYRLTVTLTLLQLWDIAIQHPYIIRLTKLIIQQKLKLICSSSSLFLRFPTVPLYLKLQKAAFTKLRMQLVENSILIGKTILDTAGKPLLSKLQSLFHYHTFFQKLVFVTQKLRV